MRMPRIRIRTMMVVVGAVALVVAYQERLSRGLEPEPIMFALLPVAGGLLACVAIDWAATEWSAWSRRRPTKDTVYNRRTEAN